MAQVRGHVLVLVACESAKDFRGDRDNGAVVVEVASCVVLQQLDDFGETSRDWLIIVGVDQVGKLIQRAIVVLFQSLKCFFVVKVL